MDTFLLLTDDENNNNTNNNNNNSFNVLILNFFCKLVRFKYLDLLKCFCYLYISCPFYKLDE